MAACKDCPPGSKRPAPRPGPRCVTHHRERQSQLRKLAQERRVLMVYGITPEQYDAAYLLQGGKCAICQRATGATKRLAVDHDHATGLPRGLCCGACNKMLGHLRDDPAAFRRAAQYLEQPPFTVLYGDRLRPVPGHESWLR